jgi:hypothetical protein
MSTFRFTCPGCSATLQMPSAPAAGKKLKCPKCGTGFVPNANGSPVSPPAAAPKPIMRATPLPPADDEEQEFEERRPRRKKKRRDEQKSNVGLIAGVVVGCVLLLGVAVMLAFIFWPDGDKKQEVAAGPPSQPPSKPFMDPNGAGRPPVPPGPGRQGPGGGNPVPPITPSNPPSAPKAREPFDFAGLDLGNLFLGDIATRAAADLDGVRWIPPQHNLIVGVDIGSLASKPNLMNAIDKLFRAAMQDSPVGDLSSVLAAKDIDHVIMTMKGTGLSQDVSQMDAAAVIIKAKTKLDRAKIAQAAHVGPPTTAKGKQYHLRQGGAQNEFLIFPADDTMIVAMMPKDPIDSLLNVEGHKPAPPAALLASLKQIGPSHLWLASTMTQEVAQMPGEMPGLPAELKPLLDVMKKSQAGAVGARLQGNQIRLNFGITFPDEAVSQEAAKLMQDAWTKQGKPLIDAAKSLAPPTLTALLTELSDGLRVRSQGDTVVASLEAKFKTIDTLVKAAQQGQVAFNPDIFMPKPPTPPADVVTEKPKAPAGDPVTGLEVGNLAPEIEGEDTDGKKFKLSDYRGKVVLLDFWGHW